MATHKARTEKVSPLAGAALGLAGLAVGLDQLTWRLSTLLGIPLKAGLEVLPSILQGAEQVLQACAHSHLSLLEGLLEMSASCLQFLLTIAGVG
jgi:hypothetical protein